MKDLRRPNFAVQQNLRASPAAMAAKIASKSTAVTPGLK
jgi:hypothetical protein